MATHRTPVSQLRLIADDMALLVNQEVSLAKQELDLKVSQAIYGVVMIVAGTLAAFIAIWVLVQALIEGVATQMPSWAAALIVGGIFAVAALIFIRSGSNRLAPDNLKPHHTINSVTRTARTIKENVK